jgi:iron-sulfur cluster assembly protein
MIQVTEPAAHQLRLLLTEKGAAPDQVGLRLLVQKGGCAGLSYGMKLDSPAPEDVVVEKEGVMFIVDASSKSYLQGCEIDYLDALSDSGFRIVNPNAVRSCGCGTSFEATPETSASATAAIEPELVPCGTSD